MEYLTEFYIFLLYTSFSIILYLIINMFKVNNYHHLLNYIGLGDNFIISSWLILIFYLCFRIFIDNEMNNVYKLQYNKFKKIAKTGDLILFRWEYVDSGYRMFSKFSHVGMIVSKNDELYLLETHPNENKDNNKPNNQGIHLYLLKNRLEGYNGTLYYTPLNKNLKRRRKYLTRDIIKNLSKYKKEILFDDTFRDYFVYNYFAQKLNIPLPDKKEMFCSKFIAYILEKNNIYKHHENLTSFEPGTFLSIKHKNKRLYGNISQIIFN